MRNQSIPVCTDLHGGFGIGCTGRLRHRSFPVAYPFGGVHGSSGFLFPYYPGFTHAEYDKISEVYNQYNFWVVFTAGFTPIPYKLITITAGVFSLNVPMFVLASVISRGLRFFLFAWLIWRYGAPIKVFIDKYFNILAIAFTVLLIGSFVAVKYLIQ